MVNNTTSNSSFLQTLSNCKGYKSSENHVQTSHMVRMHIRQHGN